MNIEDRLAVIKILLSEHACGHSGVAKAESYLMAKLREAVKLLKVKPDGRCPLCTRTQKHMIGHYPDCTAQKFLEG